MQKDLQLCRQVIPRGLSVCVLFCAATLRMGGNSGGFNAPPIQVRRVASHRHTHIYTHTHTHTHTHTRTSCAFYMRDVWREASAPLLSSCEL
jgi:hypothetical protein